MVSYSFNIFNILSFCHQDIDDIDSKTIKKRIIGSDVDSTTYRNSYSEWVVMVGHRLNLLHQQELLRPNYAAAVSVRPSWKLISNIFEKFWPWQPGKFWHQCWIWTDMDRYGTDLTSNLLVLSKE